ncbi:MAG: PIN domain-containing protein [Bacteroidota bacterium]
MILADTSVWISFLRKDDPELVYILKKYLKKEDVFTVSAVFGELFQGVKNKREAEILNIIWSSLPKVEEEELFLHAGKISNTHKLYAKGVGLIDCYLLAACFENDLNLWTLDKKLQKAFDEINL